MLIFMSKTTIGGAKNPGSYLWYSKRYDYHVGPSDVLDVKVWDHPELSTPTDISSTNIAEPVVGISAKGQSMSMNDSGGILVNNNGTIYFPYAGTVDVNGLTTDQIRRVLSRRLKKYITDPQVSVRVRNFRSKLINVIGAVRNPSATPIIDKPVTILDAIASVGGIDKETADTSHIFIVRGSGLDPRIFMLNAKSPSNLLISEKFRLMSGDIIYVPSAGISNWNRFINNILPTLTTAAYTNSLLK